ncbi:MAG: hypothetical protein AB1341_08185 [Bacillota bacterium]|uniref:Uncharacterized protein n=1 Tax=Desulforamulus putei DSM 12395 TaxID=1121429 RepID=A0A1M5CMP3_9FIRM|nr:hypothetical protein [Desulforamulus putei]SHF55867.1 hypothetical protein SAMN02745133_02969 [Desulforamulus putei DSM 12395]
MGVALLLIVLGFIVLVMAASLAMIWYISKSNRNSRQIKRMSYDNETTDEASELKSKKPDKKYRHISELINVEIVEPGIYYVNGKYLGLARIEGTNFSILSDGERDAREEMLISIQSQIKYPVQYITSTIVTDTDKEVEKVRMYAEKTNNQLVANYCQLYISELENMKNERRAMAKVSWIVISGEDKEGAPGTPAQRIRERMAILQEAFRSRAGIIMTPLLTTEEVVDTLQQVMLPEKLTKPSEVAKLCMHPIKFNIKEIFDSPAAISTSTNTGQ